MDSPGPLRCLDQDDLDGLNYLYPSCSDVSRTPVCPSRAGGRASVLRYLQTFFVVYLIPLAFFGGLKVLAIAVVWTQEQFAKRKLSGQVTRFLRRGSSKDVPAAAAAAAAFALLALLLSGGSRLALVVLVAILAQQLV